MSSAATESVTDERQVLSSVPTSSRGEERTGEEIRGEMHAAESGWGGIVLLGLIIGLLVLPLVVLAIVDTRRHRRVRRDVKRYFGDDRR